MTALSAHSVPSEAAHGEQASEAEDRHPGESEYERGRPEMDEVKGSLHGHSHERGPFASICINISSMCVSVCVFPADHPYTWMVSTNPGCAEPNHKGLLLEQRDFWAFGKGKSYLLSLHVM